MIRMKRQAEREVDAEERYEKRMEEIRKDHEEEEASHNRRLLEDEYERRLRK